MAEETQGAGLTPFGKIISLVLISLAALALETEAIRPDSHFAPGFEDLLRNINAAIVAPIGPVPIGSHNAAASLRKTRYAYPTTSAPKGLPGNANSEPVWRL